MTSINATFDCLFLMSASLHLCSPINFSIDLVTNAGYIDLLSKQPPAGRRYKDSVDIVVSSAGQCSFDVPPLSMHTLRAMEHAGLDNDGPKSSAGKQQDSASSRPASTALCPFISLF